MLTNYHCKPSPDASPAPNLQKQLILDAAGTEEPTGADGGGSGLPAGIPARGWKRAAWPCCGAASHRRARHGRLGSNYTAPGCWPSSRSFLAPGWEQEDRIAPSGMLCLHAHLAEMGGFASAMAQLSWLSSLQIAWFCPRALLGKASARAWHQHFCCPSFDGSLTWDALTLIWLGAPG